MYNRKYTPERITELKPNEIFVFGSNLAGTHGGGAARLAYNRFGAIWGQGVGLQAPLFYHAIDCKNVILPKEFDDIVQDIHNRFIDSFDHDADRTEW